MLHLKEIQPTPNPNALKFVLDGFLFDPPRSFFSASSAASDPLASSLFAIDGVSSLLFLGDFITINKRPEASWAPIKRRARQVLQQDMNN